jgi:hypothetical protein
MTSPAGQGNRVNRVCCDEATPSRDQGKILPPRKGRFVSKQGQNSPQSHKEAKNTAADPQFLSESL